MIEGPDLAPAMEDAGFVDVDVVDVTAEYRATQQAWIDGWHAHHDHLADVLGRQVVIDRQARRRNALEHIDAGLLRRSLYSATRP